MSYSFVTPTRDTRTKQELLDAGMTDQEAQELLNQQQERAYGGGMSAAELQDFNALINRLESSKLRQGAQANRARQRDTFAGGLASMMGNF